MKLIDVGCGRKKIPGSIGIDFSDYADIDIKLDLNSSPLPFEDNSIDFVHSSHCLEHLTLVGFMNMVRQFYRVCKPDGTIFIAVPYFHSSANIANPFHNNKICFNEHTFRFFSSEATCPALEPSVYSSPSCPQWGLRYSANEELGVELRLNKIEMVYFGDHESKSDTVKAELRRTQSNVVENIHYWLKPIKPAPERFQYTEMEVIDLVEKMSFIQDQAEYLEGQMQYLAAHEHCQIAPDSKTGNFKGRSISGLLDELKLPVVLIAVRESGLYLIDGHLSPYYEAIRKQDETIQSLRRIIDSIVPS